MTRIRSRYAPDDQVRRAAKLAQEMGIKPAGLKLGADGSVTVLDSTLGGGVGLSGQADNDDPDGELRRCIEAIDKQAAAAARR